MKQLANYIRSAVERLDVASLNRIRFISIALSVLVFGVFLRNAPPSAQFDMIVSSEPAMRISAPAEIRNVQLLQNEEAPAPRSISEVAPAPRSTSEVALAPRSTSEVAGGDVVSPSSVFFKESVEEDNAVSMRQEPLSLSARAAIVMNSNASRAPAYQKNADARLSFASLTKLMTAVIVTEYGKSDDIITVSKKAVATEGAAGDLAVGEKLTVGDMLNVMLVVSSNDAAVALEEYFAARGLNLIVLMNEKAIRLGMVNTHFANVSGLDADGHYATARDLAVLTLHSLAYENMWDILSQKSAEVVSMDGRFTHRLVSNNELLQKNTPHVKAGKTGYTKNALGCMITVLKDGSIIVVLGSLDREGETKKLIELVKLEA